jgi:hypothetical protein
MTQTLPPPLTQSGQRAWAAIIHIGGLLLGFVPSLVGFLILRHRGDLIREHTQTALNFQLNVLIGAIICWALSYIVIGLFIAIPLALFDIVESVVAAVVAAKGQHFEYPLAIRFVK